jgi:hypothetical protein
MFISKITSADRKPAIKKAKKAGNSSASFSQAIEVEDIATIDNSALAAEVHNINLNSLLTLQDVGSPIHLEKKNYEKGESLLKDLNKYKQSVLLTGGDASLLETLAAQAKQAREVSNNSELEQVIDEIELLAAVEAAKKGKI